MYISSASEPIKRCTKCGKEFPATPEYWHREKSTSDGLRWECKLCRCEYLRQSYAKNRKRKLENQRRYRVKNKEKESDRNRQWRIKNREKRLEYKRQYQAKNLAKARVKNSRRKARKKGLMAAFTDNDWHRAIDYFDSCCAVCGRPQGFWHTLAADHWIPLSYNGEDNPGTIPGNIVPLCHGDGGCNNSKGATLPDEWLEREFGKRKASKITARIAEYFEWVAAQVEVAR